MKIYYNPKLKEKARELRNRMTLSEKMLWRRLKSRQMHGLQFMRQKPIDEYIVDFYCSKLKLIIEIDGITHNDKQEYDLKRQKRLEKLGFSFLRFEDRYVVENLDGTLIILDAWIRNMNKTPLKL
jgi:very-short-patch-repair endonuclease